MLWCKHCKTEISEPVIVTEHDVHNEVDHRQTETFTIPFCPLCNKELDEADRCQCGEWKDKNEDWCEACIQIRDRNVIRCIASVRMDTKLSLSSESTRDLILSYFE